MQAAEEMCRQEVGIVGRNVESTLVGCSQVCFRWYQHKHAGADAIAGRKVTPRGAQRTSLSTGPLILSPYYRRRNRRLLRLPLQNKRLASLSAVMLFCTLALPFAIEPET